MTTENVRILVVTQYFWPESFRINDLVQGLKQRGHHVSVLTGLPNYPSGKLFKGFGLFSWGKSDYEGVPVYRVPLFPRLQGRSWQLALNFFSFAFFSCLLGPLFCKDKYDVILVFEPSPITVGLPALVLKKIKNAPILFWVQDLWPESLTATGAVKSKPIIKLVRHLVMFIYKGCDRILMQSKAFFDPITQLGIPKNKLYYLPNSAEGIFQSPVKDNADIIESMPDGFRVMFAGNIGVAQDFETILEAAELLREYPDICWVILGDGRQFEWLKNQISQRNLEKSIFLLGRHPVESMPSFFTHADALLVSLKKEPIFSLTIPSKVQSYLACGRPIIAALDGEGGRVIVEAEAGVVPGAENSEALAQAVLNLYAMSPLEREEMGKRGQVYYKKHFDRQLLLERLENWMILAKKDS
jgi:colanic acid biosynthesis glycosyl transferase WcaI